MITEDYVSVEIAKLLKEKGFEILTDKVYDNQNKLDSQIVVCWQEKRLPYISAPTLQMAMKWLREVHKLYMYTAFAGMEEVWFSRIYNKDKHLKDLDDFNTYEEACESAIKYCLENLI